MTKATQLSLFLGLLSLASGCAGTGGYLVDRGRDAGDIFTVGVDAGLGAKARVGPVQAGLTAAIGGAALRGGQFCKDNSWCGYFDPTGDLILIGIGGEKFEMGRQAGRRGKHYEVSTKRNWGHSLFLFLGKRVPAYYYTHIEATIGLGPSLRLGVNPGELLDFILGWTALDIFNDDLERRQSNDQIQNSGTDAPTSDL